MVFSGYEQQYGNQEGTPSKLESFLNNGQTDVVVEFSNSGESDATTVGECDKDTIRPHKAEKRDKPKVDHKWPIYDRSEWLAKTNGANKANVTQPPSRFASYNDRPWGLKRWFTRLYNPRVSEVADQVIDTFRQEGRLNDKQIGDVYRKLSPVGILKPEV